MKLRPLVCSAALLAIAGSAFAQTATPRVDQREARQEQRIEQGETSGALTTKESNRLEREQGRIQATEAQAKADGKVTAKERGHLHRMQDRASARIHRQKHDRQQQPN